MIKKEYKMDIQSVLIVILTGIAAGMLSGLVGIGGGLVIVPALVYFLGFSQHTAQGTSLMMILLPVGVLAVINYYKQGYVDMKVVWLLAIGFIVGGYFGSKIAISLPQETVKKIFAVLMIAIAIKMLFLDKKIREKANNQMIEKKI
jgi:uncharacterized membrane protein YfcA